MLSTLSRFIDASTMLKTPSKSSTSLAFNPTSRHASFLRRKDLESCNFYSSSARSLQYNLAQPKFVVRNNISPPGAPNPSGSLTNWIVGIVLTCVLPFITRKWGSLALLKNKVDTMMETTEHVTETIEAIAKGADEIIDEITDGLPKNSKLKERMEAIDDMIEEVAKGAHIANEIIDKVEETEEKFESLIHEDVKKEEISIQVLQDKKRGVKEKQHGIANVMGIVHVGSDSVYVHRNEGLQSSFNVLKNSAVNVGLESFPTISEDHGIHPPSSANEENMYDAGTRVGATPAGNTLGISSYANVTGVSSRKALNFRTLFTPAGNGVDVVVPVAYPVVVNYVRNTWGKYGPVKSMLNSSIVIFCLDAMLENGPWFIRNNSLILKKWNPNVNVLKENVGNVLVWVKLHDVPVTTFSRSSYARALIKIRAGVELKDNIMEECPKNTNVGVAKNTKKPSQAPRGVLVGLKVSNSNPFDVLNSIENDMDLSTNGGTSNMASKEANSSRSSKVPLVDEESKPLKKVDYPDDHDSDDEVASIDNDMARSMASERVNFGTNNLLEQWRNSYENVDYDYDPYDDYMYEGQSSHFVYLPLRKLFAYAIAEM
ncbi:PH, RCC1 and FYVE domains-containing protein 1-like protein isoform X1 [Tanacetum coccineum]|uniref:PH, RCC1 and FYVE domains-containing protein 1-like protein isoform X1 n=1 Tax=Tanacetum coccineum TaxID=301880 RepID=A0ABQ5FG11_9ASTR